MYVPPWNKGSEKYKPRSLARENLFSSTPWSNKLDVASFIFKMALIITWLRMGCLAFSVPTKEKLFNSLSRTFNFCRTDDTLRKFLMPFIKSKNLQLRILPRSFINRVNRKGPKTDTWYTPDVTYTMDLEM